MVLTLPRYPDAFHDPRMVPATIDGEDARGGDLSYPITSENATAGPRPTGVGRTR